MQISVINKIEDLLLIKEDWDRLFVQGDYSVFQSFEFNYYSWKYEFISDKRNQLAATVITINESVVAILPFYIDGNKQLRFINDMHFDFCDFITKESINFSAVYLYLKQEIDFKSIRLINVKQEANIYKVMSGLKIKNKVVLSFSEYSTLNVNKGIFPYNVSHFRSHQKHRINKAYKKHEDKQSQILSIDQHDFPKKDILILSLKMISLSIRKDNFLTNERLALIECLYNAGIIIINILKKEDQVISMNILLKNSLSEFIFWIDLFDDTKMINIASYIYFIRTASSENSVDINFGRGRYFYKNSNFAPEFHALYGIYIFPNTWQRLRFIIFEEVKELLKLVYKKLKN
jgi:hypothetical protein